MDIKKHTILCEQVRVHCIRFSPTGDSFAVAATEGLLLFNQNAGIDGTFRYVFDKLLIISALFWNHSYNAFRSGHKLKNN